MAGAVTPPFAEMVWATTGGDWETINRLTDILVTMNTAEDGGKLFIVIHKINVTIRGTGKTILVLGGLRTNSVKICWC